MIKRLLFGLLFFLSLTSSGQDYEPLLANQNEWHLTSCYNGCLTDIYFTDGDTLVENKMHKILDGFHYISRTFLLHENVEERKVFLTKLSPDRIDEYLLYDFSLEEGATFEMKNPITPFPEDGGLFVLDSIRNNEIWEGTFRKHFYFSPHETNLVSTQNAIWVEGVGSLSMINAAGGFPDIDGAGLLNCYFKDAEVFYSNLTPEVTVCEPTILSIPKQNPSEVIVYFPENNQSICYLKNTASVISIAVLDIGGRKLTTIKNSSQSEMQVDLSGFSNGIYIFQLHFDGFVESYKVVKG